MGGMLPTAAMSALQLGLDAAQQKAAQAQAKEQARAETVQVQASQEVASRERRDQLRRALATQRARFGAQGLAAGGGSTDAALAGLEAEADREEAAAQSMSSLRVDRINQDSQWQRRRSLLNTQASGYRSAFSIMQRGLRSVSLLDSE